MGHVPNTARKRETMEAGSSRWRSGKEPCSPKIIAATHAALLQEPFLRNLDNAASRRFTDRDGCSGLVFFAARASLTTKQGEGGNDGILVKRVSGNVLKKLKEQRQFTKAKHNRHRKSLG